MRKDRGYQAQGGRTQEKEAGKKGPTPASCKASGKHPALTAASTGIGRVIQSVGLLGPGSAGGKTVPKQAKIAEHPGPSFPECGHCDSRGHGFGPPAAR